MSFGPDVLLRGKRDYVAVVAICLALALAWWYLTLERVSHERAEVVAASVRNNANLALALEQEAIGAFKAAEQALSFLDHEYRENGRVITVGTLGDGGTVQTELFTSVSVLDSSGRVLLPGGSVGPLNLADRAYFQHHREHDGAGVLISPPVTGRVTGRFAIPVSRRYNRADGSFGGVYLVGLDPGHFLSAYQLFDLGRGGLVQLVGLDGVSLARRASDHPTFGDDMHESTLMKHSRVAASGSFVGLGRMDGIPRYVSYRTLVDYPVVVAVGTSVDETLAEFTERARKYYLLAQIVSAALALFAVILVAAMRRRVQAVKALAEKEALYRATFEQAPLGIAHATKEGKFLKVNASLCAMLGYSEQELLERSWTDVTHPEDSAKTAASVALMEADSATPPSHFEKRYRRKDGSRAYGMASVGIVRRPDGTPDYFVTAVQDITLRKAAQAALQASEERFRRYFELGLFGMAITSPARAMVEVNDKMCEILGYEREELLRIDWATLTHPDDVAADVAQFERVLAGEIEGYFLEKRFIRKDGRAVATNIAVRVVRRADGSPDYFVALMEDISERKAAQEKLLYQAQHDALTTLPNRALFDVRMAHAISQAQARQGFAGLLFIGLDRFKKINDTLGYAAGDQLLREAAKRLEDCLRPGDIVARLGSDEFAIALVELARPQDAGPVAQKVLDSFAQPFRYGEHEIHVTASLGVSVSPTDGDTTDLLTRNAAVAMVQAKKSGRNGIQFYTPAMNRRGMEQLRLETELRRALERRELLLHFQPRWSLATGKVTGLEALLRWRHPERGMISPGEFVPVLEDSGLIVPVGNWIIRAVCAQLRAWELAGLQLVPAAVNLSVAHFRHSDLLKVVANAMAENAVRAGLLEVEITETSLMEDPAQAAETLGKLREQRIRVAIDDFGTGYSSLAYLKRLPVDALKLDRSFVQGLPYDSEDVSIAKAVISLAHNLGLIVVAEGVETEPQCAFLRASNCDEVQGFLLGRPVPPEECARTFLRKQPEKEIA
jgi:diguanylate cyclase (GGDEF)-like protein/PAS domain S-box-containing protein